MTDQLMTSQGHDIIPAGADGLRDNPAAVYLAGLGESSRRPMLHGLNVAAGLLSSGQCDARTYPWGEARFQDTTLLKSQLAERYSVATANRILSAVRGALKAAWRLGKMNSEDYHKAIDTGSVKGETLPAGRSLKSGELAALMDVCANDATAAGARDAALLALLYSCGLRRAELVGLDLADYDQDAGTLRVLGKGRKERLCHTVNGSAAALADWRQVRGDAPGALFYRVRRGGHVKPSRLSTQAVMAIVAKRAAQAGVKDVSPHDFRRTCAGDLLDAGADIATVQRILGHADVSTTARYDRRPEDAKRKATGLLHVPYRGRIG